MKYPIGIQTFEHLRTDGYVYVDKTALVWEMVSSGKNYFLSRPRRFGKSLLVSTLRAYFEGRKELFEGLAIAEREKDWKVYPVFHFDLNAGNYNSVAALEESIGSQLAAYEQQYGVTPKYAEPGIRFKQLIEEVSKRESERVVVLVDEYDKPLLQAVEDEALQAKLRDTLKGFYGALKTTDASLRFVLLTGVSRFSHVSIFSDLNNLNDITMKDEYATLCGITDGEVHQYFDAGVQEMAEKLHMSDEACYAQLKNYYDGYHFSRNAEGVYNPFSVLNALYAKDFENYWFATGTPTYLIKVMKRMSYRLINLEEEKATAEVLNNIDSVANPIPLLFQSGYLTVKGYEERFRKYLLGFPNKEVEEAFYNNLQPYFTPIDANRTEFDVEYFLSDVESGRPESFMKRLQALFADGHYLEHGDLELYFQNAVWVIFKILGFYAQLERATSNGRMDLQVETSKYVYVFEFKINSTADVALRQIEEKGYAAPFTLRGKRCFLIGASFDTSKCALSDWKVKEKNNN